MCPRYNRAAFLTDRPGGARITRMADDAWMKRVCGLARRGHKDRCIAELTSRKVSATTISVEKRPVLHFAVQSGNSGLVTNLLNFGCDPNGKGPFGETPLSIAAKTGDHSMVELLASRGAISTSGTAMAKPAWTTSLPEGTVTSSCFVCNERLA